MKGVEPAAQVHRKVVCLLCGFFTCSSIVSVAIGIRHTRRGEELAPLLNAFSNARVCLHAQTQTCALELSESAAQQFDLHEAENPLFGFIYAQLLQKNDAAMQQVLSGAHVQLPDPDGSVYSFLRTLPGAMRRISSHFSQRTQYGIPEGRVVSTLLVGSMQNGTWFQLEASPWDPVHDLIGSVGHALDYLEYKMMGQNVGPLGTSESTDKNPLVAGHVVPVQEACPEACSTLSTPSTARRRGGGAGLFLWASSEGLRGHSARLASALQP